MRLIITDRTKIIYSMYREGEVSVHRACCERTTQPYSLGGGGTIYPGFWPADVTTRSPRMVAECLLARCWIKCINCSQTPKTGFLVTWLIFKWFISLWPYTRVTLYKLLKLKEKVQVKKWTTEKQMKPCIQFSTRANFVNRIPCFFRKYLRKKTKGKTYN